METNPESIENDNAPSAEEVHNLKLEDLHSRAIDIILPPQKENIESRY